MGEHNSSQEFNSFLSRLEKVINQGEQQIDKMYDGQEQAVNKGNEQVSQAFTKGAEKTISSMENASKKISKYADVYAETIAKCFSKINDIKYSEKGKSGNDSFFVDKYDYSKSLIRITNKLKIFEKEFEQAVRKHTDKIVDIRNEVGEIDVTKIKINDFTKGLYDEKIVKQNAEAYIAELEKQGKKVSAAMKAQIEHREKLYSAMQKNEAKRKEYEAMPPSTQKNEFLAQSQLYDTKLMRLIQFYSKKIDDAGFSKKFAQINSVDIIAFEQSVRQSLSNMFTDTEALTATFGDLYNQFVNFIEEYYKGINGIKKGDSSIMDSFYESTIGSAKQAKKEIKKEVKEISEEVKKAVTYIDKTKTTASSALSSKVSAKFNKDHSGKNIKEGAATADEYQYVGEVVNLLKNAGRVFDKEKGQFSLDGSWYKGVEYLNMLIAKKPELKALTEQMLEFNEAASQVPNPDKITNPKVVDSEEDARLREENEELRKKLNEEKRKNGGKTGGSSSSDSNEIRTLEQVNAELEKERQNLKQIEDQDKRNEAAIEKVNAKRENYSKEVFKNNKATYDIDKLAYASSELKSFNVELEKRNQFQEKYNKLCEIISKSYVGQYGIYNSVYKDLDDFISSSSDMKYLQRLSQEGIKGVSTKEIEAAFRSIINELKSAGQMTSSLISSGDVNSAHVITELTEEENRLLVERQRLYDAREAQLSRICALQEEQLDLQMKTGKQSGKATTTIPLTEETPINNELQERISLLKKIASSYDKIVTVEDQINDANEGTKKYEKLEEDLESAKEKVQDFKSEYAQAIVYLNDGSKVNIPLDEEFSDVVNNILKDSSKIKDIKMITPDMQKAIDGYEVIEKLLSRIKVKDDGTINPNTNRSWNNINNLTTDIGYLEKAIQDIKSQDLSGMFGDLTKLEKAENILGQFISRLTELKNPISSTTFAEESTENIDNAVYGQHKLQDSIKKTIKSYVELREEVYMLNDYTDMQKLYSNNLSLRKEGSPFEAEKLLSEIEEKEKELLNINKEDLTIYRQKRKELLKLKLILAGKYTSSSYTTPSSFSYLGDDISSKINSIDDEVGLITRKWFDRKKIDTGVKPLIDSIIDTTNINPDIISNIFDRAEKEAKDAYYIIEEIEKELIRISVNSTGLKPLSFTEESSGQLAFIEQSKKVVDLIEEESGQMAMFETASKKATDTAIEGQMKLSDYLEENENLIEKNIKGQITLGEYLQTKGQKDSSINNIDPELQNKIDIIKKEKSILAKIREDNDFDDYGEEDSISDKYYNETINEIKAMDSSYEDVLETLTKIRNLGKEMHTLYGQMNGLNIFSDEHQRLQGLYDGKSNQQKELKESLAILMQFEEEVGKYISRKMSDNDLKMFAKNYTEYIAQAKLELGSMDDISFANLIKSLSSIEAPVENIKNETGLTSKELKKLGDVYRAVRSQNLEFLNHDQKNGAIWATSEKDLYNTLYTGQNTGKEYSAEYYARNPLVIDAKGQQYNKITYLGDGTDEVSREITALYNEIQELTKAKEESFAATGSETQEYVELCKQLGLAKTRYDELSNSKSNVYGTHWTDEFVDLAKANGYDALKIENVYDSTNSLATSYAVWSEEQIKNVQLLASGEEELLQLHQQLESSASGQIGVPSDSKDVEKTKLQLEDIVELVKEYRSLLSKKNPENSELLRMKEILDTLDNGKIMTGIADIIRLPNTDDTIEDLEHIEQISERIYKIYSSTGKDIPGAKTPQSNNTETLLDIDVTTPLEESIKLQDNLGREIDENNAKLLQGTKLIDKQNKGIFTLYHNSSNVFDKFDPSRSGANQGTVLGAGNYLAFEQTGEYNNLSYGKFQTQWYAMVQNILDVQNQQLGEEEANYLIDQFKKIDPNKGQGWYDSVYKKLTSGDIIDGLSDLRYKGIDTSKALSELGYDAIKDGYQINIFNEDNIVRANDAILDISQQPFENVKEFNNQLYTAEQSAKDTKKYLESLESISISDLSKEDALEKIQDFDNTIKLNDLIGIGWVTGRQDKENLAKMATSYQQMYGESLKLESINQDIIDLHIQSEKSIESEIEKTKAQLKIEEEKIEALRIQRDEQKAIVDQLTNEYLFGEKSSKNQKKYNIVSRKGMLTVSKNLETSEQEAEASTTATAIVVENENKKQEENRETAQTEEEKAKAAEDAAERIKNANEKQARSEQELANIQNERTRNGRIGIETTQVASNYKHQQEDLNEIDLSNFKLLKQYGLAGIDDRVVAVFQNAFGQIATVLYDEVGNIIKTSFTTDFKDLTKQVKNTMSLIAKDTREMEAKQLKYGSNYDTSAIKDRITSNKDLLQLLFEQSRIYAEDDKYLAQYDQFIKDYAAIAESIQKDTEIRKASIDAQLKMDREKDDAKLVATKSKYDEKLSAVNSFFKNTQQYADVQKAITNLNGVDTASLDKVNAAFNTLNETINAFKQNVKSSASLDPVFSAIKKKNNIGYITEQHQQDFEKIGYSQNDAKAKIENLARIADRIKKIDVTKANGISKLGEEIKLFNEEEDRLNSILKIEKNRQQIQDKRIRESNKAAKEELDIVKQSYKSEKQLEDRKYRLQSSNIGASDKTKAKNNVRIADLDRQIGDIRQDRIDRGLYSEEEHNKLLAHREELLHNLRVEQEAYNAAEKQGNKEVQIKWKDKAYELKDKLKTALGSYTSADKGTIDKANTLFEQLKRPTFGEYDGIQFAHIDQSNVKSVVKKIETDTNTIIKALKTQHEKIVNNTAYAGQTKAYEQLLNEKFEGTSYEDAIFKGSSVDSSGKTTLTFLDILGNKAREIKVYIDDANEALELLENNDGSFNFYKYQSTPGQYRNIKLSDFDNIDENNHVQAIIDSYKELTKSEKQYQILRAAVDNGTATDKQKADYKVLCALRERYNNIIKEELNLTAEEQAYYDSVGKDKIVSEKNKYNIRQQMEQGRYDEYVNMYHVEDISTAYEEASKINNALNTTSQLMSSLSNRNIQDFSTVFDYAQKEVEELNTSLKLGSTTTANYSKEVQGILDKLNKVVAVVPANMNDPSLIKETMEAFVKNSNAFSKAEIGDFDAIHNTLQVSLNKGKGVVQNITLAYDQMAGSLNIVKDVTKKTEASSNNFFNSLKKRSLSLVQYLMTFASFYRVIGWVRQGVTVIRELDTALTEMRKVSDETTKSLKNFQKVSFDIADSVGTTAKQIQNSTADWMRIGESLDEASKSAKISNMLMNVSEFEDINAATESLISMSQAYKDLEKTAIVDKLNIVGNNFAISTDELATGLQKSASTLSLMGNSIDEAAALITAANTTIQDVDSVANGVRTVALRIVGTKEAEDQLQELGEEVDDYVVQTASKKQEIIQKYTAVASNNGQGVNILDENGNYKNVYTILKEISEIYKEIQEEDKKFGTNRATALVEELAGKNRSNIVSSILSNGDILEQVKNASEDSAGSAEEELNKYLDSIEGRIANFQNRVQEFWYNLLDSEMVKEVVDMGTTLIDILDNLLSGFTNTKSLDLLVDVLSNLLNIIKDLTDALGGFSTAFAAVGLNKLFKFRKGEKSSGGRHELKCCAS